MTTTDIEQQLQLIITKSQQLLKRLEFNIDTDDNLAVDEIKQLQTAREQLISNLFNQHTNDEIQKQLTLVNQMVNLDVDLQIKTEELKHALANKIIKIKKGKKSALTYKKY